MIRIKPKKKSYPAYDATKAKSYAERVKALLVERGTINEDISQVCDEAKEDGCEPALIRYVAREMMIDDTVRKERDEKRARYLHAVGLAVEAVESGKMSARQAAKVYSIGKSSVYKEMAVRAVSAEREMIAADFELPKPEDGDDGITESTAGPAEGAVDQQIAAQQDPQVARLHPTATPDPEGREGTGTHSNEAPATPSVGAVGEDAALSAMEQAGARFKASLAARGIGGR